MHDFGRIANGYVCVVAAYVHTRTQLHGWYNSAVLRLKRGGSEPRHSAMQTPKNRCQRSPVLELYVSYDHKVRNYIGCWSITANAALTASQFAFSVAGCEQNMFHGTCDECA